MKRALAERAKQQTDEQHRAVSAVSVPPAVTGMPPSKAARTETNATAHNQSQKQKLNLKLNQTQSQSQSQRAKPKIKVKARSPVPLPQAAQAQAPASASASASSSSRSSSVPTSTTKLKISTSSTSISIPKSAKKRSLSNKPSSPRKTKSPVPQSVQSSNNRSGNSASASSTKSKASSASVSASVSVSASATKSKKRIRPPNPPTPPPPEPDDSDQSAFYLKHQNKALASELYQYKFMLGLLEHEREKRREECRVIGKSVRELEGVWRGVERVIVDTLGDVVVNSNATSKSAVHNHNHNHNSLPQDVPASTGSGPNVEVTMGIIDSITKLANSPYTSMGACAGAGDESNDNDIKMEGDENDYDNDGNNDNDDNGNGNGNGNDENEEYDVEKYRKQERDDSKLELTYLNELSKCTNNFSARCSKFQQYLLKLIRNTTGAGAGAGANGGTSANTNINTNTNANGDNTNFTKKEILQVANFEGQIASLQSMCSTLQMQVEELGKARDDANNSERRVRRGLYRVASGRLKIGEVLQAVEKDGSSSLQDLDNLQNDILSSSSPSAQNAIKKEDGVANGHAGGTADAIMLDGQVVKLNDVIAMKKEINDLELVNESRDKRIAELADAKLDQDKKINNLVAQDKRDGGLQEKDILVSPLFVEISHKLTSAEKVVKRFKAELQAVNDRWASSKGDLQLAQKTINNLEKKHSARLRELSGEREDGLTGETIIGDKTHIEQAKLVMELEHKLKHALDTVRQSESIRVSLVDAHSMNEILQRQIGELKANNEELAAAIKEEKSDLLEESSKDGVQSRDKLYRMKKELSAALENKTELKYKCEQVEKQRASLVSMNMRLQQQSVEKDDMNAKSLSTILHLKQLSEQLEQEKEVLEKNLKSAQQLALAARLAAFAKAKVDSETKREKVALEQKIRELQSSLESLHNEKSEAEAQLAVSNAKVASSKSDMSGIQKRCDELVACSVENEKERKKLEEALVVAKKDAIDAAQKAAAAQAQARGPGNKFKSAFTAEELTIQVKELKNRLACPVCNTRDKKVIITRCKHMFCRQCVNANLEGRNRKCPSCGIRFDKKDVEDVWF